MSQMVCEIGNKLIRKMIIDLGFNPYLSYPGWIYDLAERLVDEGWKK